MANKTASKKIIVIQSINPFEEFLSNFCQEESITLIKNSFKLIHCKKNQRVFSEGDKVEGMFYINKGIAKVVSSYGKNEERILRLTSNQTLIGHRGLSFEVYPVSAIALTEMELTFLPIKIFNLLLKTNPDFCIFLINFISTELKNTEEQMKNRIYGEVLKKVASVICCLIDVFGYDDKVSNKLEYTLPRTDIANIAGTTYESVIRALAQIEEKKVIKIEGKSLKIINELALRKIAINLNNTVK